MRKLKTSEARLALLFGGAVFIALNLFGARFWLQERSRLTIEEQSLRTSIDEGRAWMDAASALGSARDWIDQNPPPALTPQTASSNLLEEVRQTADAQGLRQVEENLLPAPAVVGAEAAALQVKLAGGFPALTKFLFAIQTPEKWRSIPRLNIRSDEEPPNVVVDMEIRQYYRPESPTAPPAGP
ncbi:MAG: GspMb/PilO family protein [Terrimicrobiaceae bacterium]|nr:GspMb/PilO family protein [Terrimicrobiaceae bacterium]